MRRERRELHDLLARLERQVSPPSENDLRAMARTASSRPRPLPSPAPPRRWPLQARWTGVLAIALVIAVGLGVGLGALIAPSGTAAPGPIGTGFLPGPGWTVLQTGSDATPERQALAVATNVPLHPEDSARGIRNSSGLPYSTLLQLPPRGVVIVALFTLRLKYEPWSDEFFPEHELPLRVRDAMNSISYSYQMRPERPLGQYELRATVGDHRIVLHFYFGARHPSPQLIATAQRQLDRLIVASVSGPTTNADRRQSTSAAARASKIVDRTVVCSITPGGVRELDVEARSGTRDFSDPSKWRFLPHIGFRDPRTSAARLTSASMSAGRPYIQRDPGGSSNTFLLGAACRTANAGVSLSSARLSGGAASPVGDEYDCVVPAKVFVRVRAVFRAPTSLRRGRTPSGGTYYYAREDIREAAIAISTVLGKPIALATAHESGRARLFVGDTCGPSG